LLLLLFSSDLRQQTEIETSFPAAATTTAATATTRTALKQHKIYGFLIKA